MALQRSPRPRTDAVVAHDADVAKRRTALGVLCGGGLAAAWPSWALAQAAYPSKPLKVVVPFPAGGGGDTLARLVLGRALAELGQPAVFENLAGAGGNVGTTTAAKAESDGATLLYGTNGTLAINATLYKRPGFDVAKDFLPVSRLTEIGMVCVVRPGLEVTSLRDLLQQLKARPGKFTYGSAGNGTSSHLAMELLKAQQKLAVVHIPYRGGAAAMTDLIGGQVDLMIEVMPSAVPQVTAGRVRALAVTTARRAPALPDLPTMAEAGINGMDVTAWDALMVPAGTPPTVVATLNKAVQAALAQPELVRQLSARGATPSPSTPQELAAFIRSETVRWGEAVTRSGATVD